jgi:hypothetical protein
LGIDLGDGIPYGDELELAEKVETTIVFLECVFGCCYFQMGHNSNGSAGQQSICQEQHFLCCRTLSFSLVQGRPRESFECARALQQADFTMSDVNQETSNRTRG